MTNQEHTKRKLAWLTSALPLVLAGCDLDVPEVVDDLSLETAEDHGHDPDAPRGRQDAGPLESDADATVVYESRQFFSADGTFEGFEEDGDLTAEIEQRVARPSSYLSKDEPYLYDEDVFSRTREDGSGESVYRVLRRRNVHPVEARSDDRELAISESFDEAVQRSEHGGEPFLAAIAPRGYRPWDVPMAPSELLSIEDQERGWAERSAALEARTAAFKQQTEALRSFIETNGSTVIDVRPITGWIYARLDAETAYALTDRDDVVKLHADGQTFENCDSTCPLLGSTRWRLGDGRQASRMNVDAFHAAGFWGERANAGFHEVGDLNVAVIERGGPANFEDEASFMDDWNGGPSRVAKRAICSSTSTGGSQQCVSTTNFSDLDTGSNHPTQIMSIIAGDYTQDQADSSAHGDACWDGVSHCDDWESAATGMAPEASLQLWAGATSAYTLDLAIESIAESSTEKADIISMSTSHHETDRCDVTSGFTFEDALEVAFNEGIFLVSGPENAGSASLGACNLDSPGDLPVVFTVNGFDASSAACRSDYTQCLRSTTASAVGGGDLTVGASVVSRAHSAIDMQAPSGVVFVSEKPGPGGTVEDLQRATGTSFAAPHVAGAAALVKEQHLAEGQTWINNVGRLHTVMLAMGDRHRGTAQGSVGFDNVHGAGKLKLKLITNFGTAANHDASRRMRTHTATSTGTYTYQPFESLALPASTELVKCVMFEDELMSDGDDVDDVVLTLRIRDAGSNGVCESSDPIAYTEQDWSYDLKHMIAVTNDDVNLENACVELDIVKFDISDDGYTQVHTYCYYDDQSDD